MRKLVVCAGLALLTTACGEEVKQANGLLYQAGDTASRPVPGSAYSDSVPVGPDGKKAMLRVNWTVERDSANCLRVASMRVDRVGGDPGVNITGVRHRSTGCETSQEGSDTTRFETARISLDYTARKGIESFKFSGPVAEVTGSGRLKK
ncbi:MAG: hypothetical protein AB1941_04000 [Gemmatimonadota bacterium]